MEFSLEEVLTSPIQVPLGSLLKLVPNFHNALLRQSATELRDVAFGKVESEEDDSALLPTNRIMDTRIPELSVRYHGTYIDKVLLDGGVGVNIITQAACERFGPSDWEPAPFVVLMEDHRRVQRVGLLRGIVLDVAGLSFVVSLVVLNIEDH
ncbi:hypothetical protein DD594_25975, partial [Enterobacter cloacae complex sp. 4DZ1-17B1]|uniref:hypothetical protein n=1 Tax=Enterobacter cloacae complex sp. 4DZ1-17B1 TaxID=2511991 RepID=UPI0010272815